MEPEETMWQVGVVKIFHFRPIHVCAPLSQRRTPVKRRSWQASSARVLAALGAALLLGACNDLTDPLPSIAGTYTYQSRSSDFVRLNRNGTITIDDFNRRSANFTGTFDFTNDAGEHVTGGLIGAFVTPDHIYFRFLNSHFEFHEGSFAPGRAVGEIFFQGITYEPSGSTFSIVRTFP